MQTTRDHGGGVDSAVARWGGTKSDWLDLSTGINPVPYPVPDIPARDWTALPDRNATDRLLEAARQAWDVPDGADIVLAPGASALIARLPLLWPAARVRIPQPTYNEHQAAFSQAGWRSVADGPAEAVVVVHPNNPDGRTWHDHPLTENIAIIDESFCDIAPDISLVTDATRPNRVVLKSFGKFWGLAGLRLGFAITSPALALRLREALGPWPVAGPALRIGAAALSDRDWADQTRRRLADDSARLDQIMTAAGAALDGGTPLFRLYTVADAAAWQDRFARHKIWTRIFPYSSTLLRLGLPPAAGWTRLTAALQAPL